MYFRSALHLLLLSVGALLISYPILTDGYFTYLDNPVHLAEIYSLSESDNGWSQIAFDGFPLRDVHSPLWYGIIVGLVRFDINAEFLYKLFLFIGYISPSLALYAAFRDRQIGFFLATLYLFLHFVISGNTAPLGGMFTFGLSVAFYILAIYCLDKIFKSDKNYYLLALCIGLIGLTHLFTFVAIGLHIGVSLLVTIIFNKLSFARVIKVAISSLVGVLISLFYIVPALGHSPMDNPLRSVWSMGRIFQHYFTQLGIALVGWSDVSMALSAAIISLPAFLTVVLALLAAIRRERLSLPTIRYIFSILLIIVLLVVDNVISLSFLGPLPWRYFYFVFIFLFFIIKDLDLRLSKKFLGIIYLIFSFNLVIHRLYLNEIVPRRDSTEIAEVREVWRELRELSPSAKVYLQDTFLTPPLDRKLVLSHIMVLTSHETKVHQLGPYYGLLHFDNVKQTSSEMNQLFGKAGKSTEFLDYVSVSMSTFACDYLLLSNPEYSSLFTADSRYEVVSSIGRFTLYKFISRER